MKKKIILISIFYLVTIFTVVMYYNDQERERRLEFEKMEANHNTLKNKMIQHLDRIRVQLPEAFVLQDIHKDTISLPELTKEGARIGLYLDNRQCTPCRTDALDYLKFIVSKIPGIQKPVVFVGGFNLREFRLFNEEQESGFPCYMMQWMSQLEFLTQNNTPFFFVLQRDGTISSILYTNNSTNDLIGSLYFSVMAKKCYENSDSQIKLEEGLLIENPVVDLGDIKLRETYAVHFRVKNNSTKKCNIQDVVPLCNCIMPDSVPQIILPGETGIFKIKFLSNTKGEITRSLSVKTDFKKMPSFYLKIKGNVR